MVDIGQDDSLPSIDTTMRFLALCDRHGSHDAAVAAVARGRRAGVSGLPDGRAWPELSGTRPRCMRRSSTLRGPAPE